MRFLVLGPVGGRRIPPGIPSDILEESGTDRGPVPVRSDRDGMRPNPLIPLIKVQPPFRDIDLDPILLLDGNLAAENRFDEFLGVKKVPTSPLLDRLLFKKTPGQGAGRKEETKD